jgi:REP element-mobilizing transposase RayT
MHVSDYQPGELHFAYCNHVYLRIRTRALRPCPPLETLDQETLQSLVEWFGIHVLECESAMIEARLLASLQPAEPLSTGVSKLKGQLSRWLREQIGDGDPTGLLARGYFGCTSGKSTLTQVEAYLPR